MNDKEILTKILEITEDKKAGKQFLQQFRSLKPETFALIYASPEIIAESGEALHYEIKLLYHVNLFPVLVIHKNTIAYIRNFYFFNKPWESDRDVQSKIPVKIIRKKNNLQEKIVQIIKEERIPVIITDKIGADIFTFLSEITFYLNTNKLIYLWNHSGIRNSLNESIIYNMYINKDFDEIYQKQATNQKEQILLDGIKSIFAHNKNSKFSAVVTAPVSLLKELFTVKGSGTLIKRGCKLNTFTDQKEINANKLIELMEQSFRKNIKNDFMLQKFDLYIIESEYKGCAILKKTEYGYLLSKYAVDDIAQGEGIGGEIWDKMISLCDKIYWRAKKENPINLWYWEKSDGMLKTDKWFLYWIGVDRSNILNACDSLIKMEEDFL